MVDWWNNTRGEDVRLCVRGFGLRPSWDPEDAYKDTNITHEPSSLLEGNGTDNIVVTTIIETTQHLLIVA